MRKILVTGMSGSGKSSALAELEKRGFAVVPAARAAADLRDGSPGGHIPDGIEPARCRHETSGRGR